MTFETVARLWKEFASLPVYHEGFPGSYFQRREKAWQRYASARDALLLDGGVLRAGRVRVIDNMPEITDKQLAMANEIRREFAN